jgi:hypothetical protein
MYKITDILTLGTEYTVTDQTGKVIRSIQVIPQTDILSAALGSYSEEFGTMQSYLDKSIAVLSGYDDIDPSKVLWYSTTEDEVVLSELLEYAVRNDYDKIILEHLEELE